MQLASAARERAKLPPGYKVVVVVTDPEGAWVGVSANVDYDYTRRMLEGALYVGDHREHAQTAASGRLMKYRKKPETIEAVTFEELVEYGLKQVGAAHNGMPWSFEYKGLPVTHENDDCYLIGKFAAKLRRSEVLVVDGDGDVFHILDVATFNKLYEPAEPAKATVAP